MIAVDDARQGVSLFTGGHRGFPSSTRFQRVLGCHMNRKVIVHEAQEGGYWAEVPSIAGCATQGETLEELMANLQDAVEGCLAVDLSDTP